MTDMPSYGARQHLDGAERADEFFVLLSDAAAALKNIETLRRVLGADADALAKIVEADHDGVYDPLRNLQDYGNALVRLTEVALERVTEIGDRAAANTEEEAAAKPNGRDAHVPEAALAS